MIQCDCGQYSILDRVCEVVSLWSRVLRTRRGRECEIRLSGSIMRRQIGDTIRSQARRTARGVTRAACLLVLISAIATPASATIVADVTHLKGRRQNHLMGYGLVVGLPGTGDGGNYAASIRQLQALLERFAVPVTQAELSDTKNIAIVWVEATLSENGVREGDTVDVQVSAAGAAPTAATLRIASATALAPPQYGERSP